MHWFNNIRLHSAIGHVPPVEYEQTYYRTQQPPTATAAGRTHPPLNPGRFNAVLHARSDFSVALSWQGTAVRVSVRDAECGGAGAASGAGVGDSRPRGRAGRAGRAPLGCGVRRRRQDRVGRAQPLTGGRREPTSQAISRPAVCSSHVSSRTRRGIVGTERCVLALWMVRGKSCRMVATFGSLTRPSLAFVAGLFTTAGLAVTYPFVGESAQRPLAVFVIPVVIVAAAGTWREALFIGLLCTAVALAEGVPDDGLSGAGLATRICTIAVCGTVGVAVSLRRTQRIAELERTAAANRATADLRVDSGSAADTAGIRE